MCFEIESRILNELKRKNEELKKGYANMLKHQQIPFFKPKCLDNVGVAKPAHWEAACFGFTMIRSIKIAAI